MATYHTNRSKVVVVENGYHGGVLTFGTTTSPVMTGVGSLVNVYRTPGPVESAADLASADDRLKELLFFHLLDAGIYMARRGFIALSIEITNADADALVAAVEGFCLSSAVSR